MGDLRLRSEGYGETIAGRGVVRRSGRRRAVASAADAAGVIARGLSLGGRSDDGTAAARIHAPGDRADGARVDPRAHRGRMEEMAGIAGERGARADVRLRAPVDVRAANRR